MSDVENEKRAPKGFSSNALDDANFYNLDETEMRYLVDGKRSDSQGGKFEQRLTVITALTAGATFSFTFGFSVSAALQCK